MTDELFDIASFENGQVPRWDSTLQKFLGSNDVNPAIEYGNPKFIKTIDSRKIVGLRSQIETFIVGLFQTISRGPKGDTGHRGDTGATGATGATGGIAYNFVYKTAKPTSNGQIYVDNVDDSSPKPHILNVRDISNDGVTINWPELFTPNSTIQIISKDDPDVYYVVKRTANDYETESGQLYLFDVEVPVYNGTIANGTEVEVRVIVGGTDAEVDTGNTLYVDKINGDNGTAARGDFSKPFQTCQAAEAAALAGDCIHVWPGDYTITASLGKHLVNWLLYPNVSITSTSSTGNNISIFSDGGSAKTFSVTGYGDLICGGTGATNATNLGCVLTTNPSSDIVIQCRNISLITSDAGGSGIRAALNGMSGTLKVQASKISSTDENGWAVWWGSGGQAAIADGGDLHVRANDISASGFATVGAYAAGSATNSAFINADKIVCTATNGIGISHSATASEAKLWVTAALISADGIAVWNTSGNSAKTYITAQKIAGCVNNVGDSVGVVKCDGGRMWLNTQKITGTYSNAAYITAGTVQITCQQIEDLGSMTRAFRVSGGSLEVEGAVAVMAGGDGFSHSGGAARYKRCRFNTSAGNFGSNGGKVSASGVVVEQCVFINNTSTRCIVGIGQTVTNYGSVSNTPKGNGVTVNVQDVLVDVNVL